MAIPWEAYKSKEWIAPKGMISVHKNAPFYLAPVTTYSKEATEKSVTRQHSSILGDYGKEIFCTFFFEVKFLAVVLGAVVLGLT